MLVPIVSNVTNSVYCQSFDPNPFCRRATVPVSPVWQRIQSEEQSSDAYDETYRRETTPV